MSNTNDEEWIEVGTGRTNTTPDFNAPVNGVSNRDLICPNMSNQQFSQLIIKLRGAATTLIEDRIRALALWSADEQSRVQKWFGASNDHVRSILHAGLPRLLHVMHDLRPANVIRHSEENNMNISCTPTSNLSDSVASVCKPDSARRIISIHPKFCTLPEATLWTENKIAALIHECTHFTDAFDSDDAMYGTTIGLSFWAQKNPSLAITNADSITCYVSFSDQRLW